MFLTLLTTYALAQNSSYEPDPTWHAPSKPAMRRNPLTSSPEITGGGKKLFEVHCAECHQASGSGMANKHSADLRQPIVQSQSDGALFWKITNGNPGRGMPSFSRLPEKQRWQLVLFLRTLRAPAGQSATKRPRVPLLWHRRSESQLICLGCDRLISNAGGNAERGWPSPSSFRGAQINLGVPHSLP